MDENINGVKDIDSSLIFVGGGRRTGTTLLQGLICQSSETIAVTNECSYFRKLIEAYELRMKRYAVHTHDYFDSKEDFSAYHKNLTDKYLHYVQNRFGKGKLIVQKEPRLTRYFKDI